MCRQRLTGFQNTGQSFLCFAFFPDILLNSLKRMVKQINYEEYINRKSAMLREEIRVIKPLVSAHPPTLGAFYEAVLKKFIKGFVPGEYKIGTGFVIDVDSGKSSRQIDIMVYKDDIYPPIYQDENFVIVERGMVYAGIEVKADIDTKSLNAAKENRKSFEELVYGFTHWYLIVVNSKHKPRTYLRAKQRVGNPTRLFVLDKYYFDESDKVFPNAGQPISATEVFLNNFIYSLIHQVARPIPKITEYR